MDSQEPVVVIGGGLFGLTTAIILAENGYKVTVVERNFDVMQEASLINQNRIHYGYHYPRSIETGREALEGLPSFKEYFNECINDKFTKYYGIARHGSHLTPGEFESFCRELNIVLEESWPDESMLNRDMLDACWKVYEPVFDYHTLRYLVLQHANKHRNLRILRNASVASIDRLTDSRLKITLSNGYRLDSNFLVNATYSGLTEMLKLIDEQMVKANYELLVLPILKLEEAIAPCGITIMDGPFCSLVPKGFDPNQYILSHVVHSVAQSHLGYSKPEWNSFDGMIEMDIINHSSSYFPILKKMKLWESWITTKMVLPNQDIDDARPTLVLKHSDNIYSVFSGKITTCVNAGREVLAKVNQLHNR